MAVVPSTEVSRSSPKGKVSTQVTPSGQGPPPPALVLLAVAPVVAAAAPPSPLLVPPPLLAGEDEEDPPPSPDDPPPWPGAPPEPVLSPPPLPLELAVASPPDEQASEGDASVIDAERRKAARRISSAPGWAGRPWWSPLRRTRAPRWCRWAW